MYRVFLVDCDELLLSEIEETISWRSNGFEVLGSFSDPSTALEEMHAVLDKLAGKLAMKNSIPLGRENTYINTAFLELVQYLKGNFKEKYTLERLSREFNLSSGYICNLFIKHHNSTLTRFLTDLRMQAATDMIKSKDKNLKVIAVECGYADYYYFNKVFKKYYGVAPSQYIEKIHTQK